jgi:hypothetical protein
MLRATSPASLGAMLHEWKKVAVRKQLYTIALADGRLMALARPMGDVALSGGREGAQLRDRHDTAN